jgi:DNA-binding NarL/FixJ family response regulator
MESVLAGVQPEVVVVDVADNPDEAVEVCRVINEKRKGVPVLALLCCARPTLPSHVRDMVSAGVSSFVDAGSEAHTVCEAITDLKATGAMYVRLQHRAWMHAALPGRGEHRSPDTERPLSDQHRTLVGLIAKGLTNQEIGKILHLAPNTVHHRVGELCSRLGLRNRVALAGWAGAHGYVHTEPLDVSDTEDAA